MSSSSAIEEVVLARLRPGEDEPYVFDGELELQEVLAAVLGGPAAWPEVRRALQLCVALERRLGSPTAAAQIKAALSQDPRVVALIEKNLSANGGVEELRGFLERQGRELALRAPNLNDGPPPDTVRLGALRPQARGWLR